MTSMRQWEYKVIHLKERFEPVVASSTEITVEGRLNILGNDGWELVAINPPYVFLKRPQ